MAKEKKTATVEIPNGMIDIIEPVIMVYSLIKAYPEISHFDLIRELYITETAFNASLEYLLHTRIVTESPRHVYTLTEAL